MELPYDGVETQASMALSSKNIKRVTTIELLRAQRVNLTNKLKEIDEALALADANPDLVKFLEAIEKARY